MDSTKTTADGSAKTTITKSDLAIARAGIGTAITRRGHDYELFMLLLAQVKGGEIPNLESFEALADAIERSLADEGPLGMVQERLRVEGSSAAMDKDAGYL